MKTIIGLGNIGEKYTKTRHNIGFIILDWLSEKYDPNSEINWKNYTKLNCFIKEIIINNEKVLLVKPTTFMNLSGICAQKLINYYKIDLKNLLIIFDDIDLAFGEIRFREKGSAGTHNGVKSIVNELKTENIKRIKIGIENRKNDLKAKFDLSDFVLAKFNETELKELNNLFPKIEEKLKESFLIK